MDTYNDNEHRTIKTTPNKAWGNNNLQTAHHLSDIIHNEQVYKTIPFKSGENVRILEEKDNQFSKGHAKFSNETYKIADRIGYKISVVNDDDNKLHRKFKPSVIKLIIQYQNHILKKKKKIRRKEKL